MYVSPGPGEPATGQRATLNPKPLPPGRLRAFEPRRAAPCGAVGSAELRSGSGAVTSTIIVGV